MKLRTLALVAAGFFALATQLHAAPDEEPAPERVKGATLIDEDAQLESVFPKMLGLTFDQGEIDLFLDVTPKIGDWIDQNPENKKAWNSVDGSDNPLKKILALDVWSSESVGVTGPEFFTLVIKLKMAQEIIKGNIKADQLKQQRDFLQGMMNDPNLPEESKGEMEKNVNMMTAMIDALENYPEGNRKAYGDNKEKLDGALDELEAWGDEEDPEPKAREGGKDVPPVAPEEPGKEEPMPEDPVEPETPETPEPKEDPETPEPKEDPGTPEPEEEPEDKTAPVEPK